MTTPNPTTTTREREAARDIASHYPRNLYGRQYHDCIERIATALAQARREGKREALTEAAQVALDNKPKDWSELDTTSERITAAIEALRDEP